MRSDHPPWDEAAHPIRRDSAPAFRIGSAASTCPSPGLFFANVLSQPLSQSTTNNDKAGHDLFISVHPKRDAVDKPH
jgi:hypothetical protein